MIVERFINNVSLNKHYAIDKFRINLWCTNLCHFALFNYRVYPINWLKAPKKKKKN